MRTFMVRQSLTNIAVPRIVMNVTRSTVEYSTTKMCESVAGDAGADELMLALLLVDTASSPTKDEEAEELEALEDGVEARVTLKKREPEMGVN